MLSCLFVAGGPTCEEVTTECGSTYTLSSGESVTVSNKGKVRGKPLAAGQSCAYLFKTPLEGHSLRLHVDELNIPDCSQYLDVRNNAVGQQSPVR